MYVVTFAFAITRPQKTSEYVFAHMLSLVINFCVKSFTLLFASLGKFIERLIDCSVFPSLYLIFKVVVNMSLTVFFLFQRLATVNKCFVHV